MARKKNEGQTQEAQLDEGQRIEERRKQALEEARLPADSPAARGRSVPNQSITGLNRRRAEEVQVDEVPQGAGSAAGSVNPRTGSTVTVDTNSDA